MQKAVLLSLFLAPLTGVAEEDTNWISFSQSALVLNEISGAVSIPVVRSGDLSVTSTVQFSFLSAGANINDDFAATDGVLSFEPGQSSLNIAFEVLDDEIPEGLEDLAIQLSSPTGGHSLSNKMVEIRIFDNDAPWSGVSPSSSSFNLSNTVAINALLVRPDHRFWFGGVPLGYDGGYGLIERDGSISLRDWRGISMGKEVTALSLDHQRSLIFGQIGRAAGRVPIDFDTGFFANVPASGVTRDLFVRSDGRVLLAGDFALASSAHSHGLVGLSRNGTLDPGFILAGTESIALNTAITDPAGRIVAAYTLTNESQVIHGLGRWNPDGTRDAGFGSVLVDYLGTSSEITVMENEPGQSRTFVAIRESNAEGGLTKIYVTDWQDELETGAPVDVIRGTVHAIAFAPLETPPGSAAIYERIYGGEFTEFNGEPVNNISGMPTGAGPNGPIRALAVEATGAVLVGGHFTEFSGLKGNGLVRLRGHSDVSQPNRVFWDNDDFRGFERLEQVEISLSRSGDLSEELTVELAITPIAPASLDDLSNIPSSITFLPGASNQVVTLGLANDTVRQGHEAFTLTLTRAAGSSAVLSQPQALLTILDDEIPGTLDGSFSLPLDYPLAATKRLKNGKILVGSIFNRKLRVARLNADGSADASFVTNGLPSLGYTIYQIRQIEEAADGKIYVTGGFSDGSTAGINSLARLNSDGTLDESFNPRLRRPPSPSTPQPYVSFALQPDGKIIIGAVASASSFNHQENFSGNWPIRINQDGSLDRNFSSVFRSSGSLRPHSISDIELDDGRIFVTGSLSSGSGVTRAFFCLSSAGAFLADYPLVILGTGSSMLRDGDSLYLAGELTTANDLPIPNLIRINLNTDAIDESFQVTTDGSVLEILKLDNGQLLISGNFTTVNGRHRERIAILHPDGSLDENMTFGLGLNFPARPLAQQTDGKIIVGGPFTNADLVPVRYVARFEAEKAPGSLAFKTNRIVVSERDLSISLVLNRTGGTEGVMAGSIETVAQSAVPGEHYHSTSTPFSFGPGEAGSLRFDVPLIHQPGFTGHRTFAIRLEVGGVIQEAQVLIMEADLGSLDQVFAPSFGGPGAIVNDVAVSPAGAVLVVGNFSSVEGLPLTNVAFFNSDFSAPLDQAPGLIPNLPPRYAAIQSDGRFLLGGDFTTVGESNVFKLARVKTGLSYDWDFRPQRSYNFNAILELPDGKLFGYGSESARLLPTGAPDHSYSGGASFVNVALPWADGRLLTGRRDYSGLRLLNSNGGYNSAFNGIRTEINSIFANVFSIALLADERLLVGGDFNKINGLAAPPLIRVTPEGTLDSSFNAVSIGTNGPSSSNREGVHSILPLPGGDILIGGNFRKVAGQDRTHLALLGPDGELRPGFAPELEGESVRELLLLPNGDVLVRGAITRVNGAAVQGLFKLSSLEPQPPHFHIATPATGTEFSVGEPITIAATAFDPDGFLAGVTVVAAGQTNEFTAPPYRLVLDDLPPGVYTVTGSAIDAHGLESAPFEPLTFQVVAPPLSLGFGVSESGLDLSFTGHGQTYRLYATEDFLTWEALETFPSLTGEASIEIEFAPGQRFFKLVQEE